MKAMIGMSGVVGMALVLGSATLVGAQEPVPSDEITVSQEPGVCTNQGAFCERLLDWTGSEVFAETTAWLVSTPFKIAVILLLAFYVNRLARRAIARTVDRLGEVEVPEGLVSESASLRTRQRADSIGALLTSGSTALIFGIALILVLDNLGVSVVPLLASLGIAGVAIGFGAQSLIEDLIAGVMLVVEDQFGVGDRVDVDVVDGVVERVTLRSTVILAADGVRWYVPNSEIRRVANESQHLSRASVQLGVAYDSDLVAASSVIRDTTVELLAEEPWTEAGALEVHEPIVVALADTGVTFEVRVFMNPRQRRPFERALRPRLLAATAAAGIVLPNRQLDVWLRKPASSAGETGLA